MLSISSREAGHPTREREAVAPIDGAPHTVRCPRLSAIQAALVSAGIARVAGNRDANMSNI